MSTPSAISLTRTALRLRLHIKPSSSTPRIVSLTPQLITLAVAQPPRDGEANRGVVEFMCQVLGCRRSDAEIVKGLRGRQKVLVVEGFVGPAAGEGEREKVLRGVEERLRACVKGEGGA